MIRKDFISKYIEELGKSMARLIAYEIGDEDDNFIFHFNEMLRSYYRLDDSELATLLIENEERDQFLLSDELKKSSIRTYLKAARVFLTIGQTDKAILSFKIVERIQNVNSGIFQFPTEEDQIIEKEFKEIREKIML